ncbi:MAG: deoxyribodipyrimidine photo-lyase [Rhizobiales bacterium]|nr:deoxyribodipyrimidine photo-lyase [Hyphomicrobiales bacterium]MBO6697790.1 deoxyribodipyrimidine photo-lyase [Hyphomicrobiales bacterium]MBO6735955.1 deoxyribodipyrimidine photo-lyase [Hyphomicrobiales bacterium]MBO6912425.1 deoxyribodipyrimidine photo-lyase [Hyphomicrobiales bacterium]MBO6955055.1 deoxyribodipyrimidine photo-lyase [Hyphomicrobiales bacterium]
MIELVWFKRDLRAADHAPLAMAAQNGPVLPLVAVESDYWELPETSSRHYLFWRESVDDLRTQGVPLCVRIGKITAILNALHESHGIRHIWSHEETGNAWTYERDKAVARWCHGMGIGWTQIRQFGVVRGPINRDRWARQWEAFMAEPLATLPDTITYADATSEPLPSLDDLGLVDDPCPQRQRGGRARGLALFESFLTSGRARHYQRAMSSPISAADACSRLSPHLAYGTLSMREVVQRAYNDLRALKTVPPDHQPIPPRGLNAFIARLHWHCHFIQKFESEPEMEWRDLHPAFREARTKGVGDPLFEAWAIGNTGFPFVDACMRSLIATGWINFRMRAMLVAFASYHLWLDWRATGTRLAQLFTDYEPGIHWPQVQMQSGSTAINTPRLYNPVKQGHDQDPDGLFIKRWVPELSQLTGRAVHEPWTLSPLEAREQGFVLDESYPAPIIDHQEAARAARERLTRIRASDGFYQHQRAIYLKHGSRKSSRHTPKQGRAWVKKKPANQLELDL